MCAYQFSFGSFAWLHQTGHFYRWLASIIQFETKLNHSLNKTMNNNQKKMLNGFTSGFKACKRQKSASRLGERRTKRKENPIRCCYYLSFFGPHKNCWALICLWNSTNEPKYSVSAGACNCECVLSCVSLQLIPNIWPVFFCCMWNLSQCFIGLHKNSLFERRNEKT